MIPLPKIIKELTENSLFNIRRSRQLMVESLFAKQKPAVISKLKKQLAIKLQLLYTLIESMVASRR